MSQITLDPTSAGEDGYIAENDPTATPPPTPAGGPTETGKYYQVTVPNWGPVDPNNTPQAVATLLGEASPDKTWPPFVYWYGSGLQQNPDGTYPATPIMQSYIRLGQTPNQVDSNWGNVASNYTVQGTTPPPPISPNGAVDPDGLLLTAVMINAIQPTDLASLVNYCGHREHTDGNRILTTYGDHVNVVNGNYSDIILSEAKWELDHIAWTDPGTEVVYREEVQGLVSHFLGTDLYYDAVSSTRFPDIADPAYPANPRHYGEDLLLCQNFAAYWRTDPYDPTNHPQPYNDDGTRDPNYAGTTGTPPNTTAIPSYANGNLIPEYYEYVNGKDIRATVSAELSHAEKLFAGRALSVVCTRYTDSDHTHTEQNDFGDWSDGDLWEYLCTRNYQGTIYSTGDISDELHSSGGDIKETVQADDGNIYENSTAGNGNISSKEVAARSINVLSTAGAAINELRAAGAEISDGTFAGGALVETRGAVGAIMGAAVSGGQILDVRAAAGNVVDATVALGALLDIKAALAIVDVSLAAVRYEVGKAAYDNKEERIENIKNDIKLCAQKTEVNKSFYTIARTERYLLERANGITRDAKVIYAKLELI